jgi:hypothetical protein
MGAHDYRKTEHSYDQKPPGKQILSANIKNEPTAPATTQEM